MWQTPKTNWQASDHYDYTTFNRIFDNLETVEAQCEMLFSFYAPAAHTAFTALDIPYASVFNEIETRLHKVNIASYGFDIGTQQTYYSNQPVMDYAELNRVESALKRLHDENAININILPKLPIRLGNMRGVKV